MSTRRFDPPSSGDGPDHRQPAMPEVLYAMRTALNRRSAPSRLRRRLLRGAGLSLVLALVSGTALAASGQWDSFWTGHSDPKSFVLSPPPDLQLSTLAVFRRSQDNRDRNELLSAFLKRTARDESSVRLRYVRFLRPITPTTFVGPRGRRFEPKRRAILVLVPQRRALRGMTAIGSNPLCTSTVEDAWDAPRALLPGYGAKRADGRPNERPQRPEKLEDRVTAGGSCASIQTIRVKGLMSGSFNTGALYGLVPDGVSQVRATTLSNEVVTSKVVNNSFELLAPGRNEAAPNQDRMGYSVRSGRFRHQSVEWVGPDGMVVRHISQ